MDKTFTRRKIPTKKLSNLLKKQEHLTHQKLFNPGYVQFLNTPSCRASLVNFFGDVHTQVFTLKTNHKDKVLGVGCSNGQVKVYDIYEGNILSIGHSSRFNDFPCTSFRWKPRSNNHFVVCNCDGTIKWYNREEETPYGHYESQDRAYLCSDYQLGQEWAVFGTDHNTIEVFDNETMKHTHTYEAGGPTELTPNHHTNRVYCVKCMPGDENVFISGGWDSTVHVWDTRVRSGSVRKICGPSITSDSLDFKDNQLLAGNYQNNEIVQLFDFGTGALLQTLDINQPENSISYCFTAAFAHHSKHNLIAVGLAGSNKVKILCDNQLVSEIKFQAAPLSLDFCEEDGRDYLIVGGIEGTIYSIKIKISK